MSLQPIAPVAERRVVTMLFADLAHGKKEAFAFMSGNFTAMELTRSDPALLTRMEPSVRSMWR